MTSNALRRGRSRRAGPASAGRPAAHPARARGQPAFPLFARLAALVVLALLAVTPPATAAAGSTDPDFAAIDRYVEAEIADAGIPGAALAVVHGNQVLHIRGFGLADEQGRPVTPQTPFVLGSVSKSFTALAVMQLAEQGRLDLDAPAQRYLPWFRVADGEASRRITLRRLLNQTSGLPTSAGLEPLRHPATTLAAQVQALAGASLSTAPGAGYAYSNANYEVLGLVVEAVSGEAYGAYVQRHIFEPLAMRQSQADLASAQADGLGGASSYWFGLRRPQPPVYRADFLPAGWLMSSAEDMAHYAIAQLGGGRYGAAAVLSPAGVDLLHRPAVRQGTLGGQEYAMGWVVGPIDGVPMVWHDGDSINMHAVMYLDPRQRWGVVVLFNGSGTLYAMLNKQDAIAQGVLSQVLGIPSKGTIEHFYPAFDLVAALLLALAARALLRTLRRGPPVPAPAGRLARVRRVVSDWMLPVWREGLAPLALLYALPAMLDAPWTTLVRTDIGLWAFVLALLLLATGAARLIRAARFAVQQRLPAHREDGPGPLAAAAR